ncbi:MAG: nucleoside hydrolase [Scytolyngbya sp. HA4215-MV1]|nr:nucleoside hydrolase [Scytolyngbya sp. HA4215-MV1]
MQKPKIILDTDPGGDDIFALLWLQSLIRQGLADLVAVTTAEGNISARQTFATASKLLKLGGIQDVEVGKGVAVVSSPGGDASHIHGSDGMGNLSHGLPEGDQEYETARDSDEILIEALHQYPGEITILAIAPFTNLAAASAKSPGILRQAKEIVLMAGAFQYSGNVTPHAEFNVAYNPQAAQTVLDSRNDTVILPLDITHQLILTEAMMQPVFEVNLESAIGHLMRSLCRFMISTALVYRETGGVSGFLVHDAATIGYLFYPEIFSWQRATVVVETQGQWTRGQTLIDTRHGAKSGANAWVATQVDVALFFMSLIEDLKFLIRT